MHYYAQLERHISEEAGFQEMFQVVSIEDDEGNNYTESLEIEQDILFDSLEELAREIEQRTGEPAEVDEA
jgi:hypothetical protein